MARYRRRRYALKFNSQINVVPYIDVMLVLLVIFMVTAPLLSQGIQVNLPQAKSRKLSDRQLPIVVSVDQRGRYFLNVTRKPNQPLNAIQLMNALEKRLGKKTKKPTVYIKGDRQVNYGKMIHVMSLLKQAGTQQIGLITDSDRST